MLVMDWMSRDVLTIDVDASMQDALALLKENRIRMLPVVRGGAMVGVLSDSDIKRASASDASSLDIHELLYLISRIKVKDIMSKDPVTVPEDFTVEEAAQVLMENKISGAPVLDADGSLVGIITRDDVFQVLISMSSLPKKGVQFGFKVEDRPGSIKEVSDVIRAHGGRIASILSTTESAPAGYRMVYIRAYDIDRAGLRELIAGLKEKADLLYMVDHRDNKREVFTRLKG